MSENATFLAVDLGASGGRALVGEVGGQRIDLRELHRFPNGPIDLLGHLHWDALHLHQEILTGLNQYARAFDKPLAGISVDTWGVDFGLLDRAGRLLGNPYHYRDKRAEPMPQRLAERISSQELYETTGIQVMPINTLYQLYSMVEAEDPQLEQADALLMMPDLFHYWLTGEATCEYTIASTSQMLAARERRWATELLNQLGIPTDMLLEPIMPGTVISPLREAVAAEVGLPGGAPVIATGGHDTAGAVAGIPDLDENSVYISSGTWSLVGVEVSEPVINERARRLNFTNEGGVGGTIRLLKNVAGLWLLQESKRQWAREGRMHTWEEILEQAAQAPPFSSLIDPDAPQFLNPGDMPAAIRAYCRQTDQPEPDALGAVARCCLESLALRYRWVLEALQTLTGRKVDTIRVVGGGSLNQLLNQFTADACGCEVVAGPVEATALGNILMQAVATGQMESISSGRRVVAASVARQTFQPQHVEAWDEAFTRFTNLVGMDPRKV